MPATAERPDLLQSVVDAIPEDFQRYLVDGMPKLRISMGPVLAERLGSTPPEQRTWADGMVTGLLSSTDFWDGLGARLIGPTDYGRELDREGDRSFVMPQQRALRDNGEIPSIHYDLKRFRETAMKGVRWWGARNDKSLKSLQVNRAKTFAEMTELTMAHSPLSQNEDLMRWGASIGTALSLTGLFETVFQYMGDSGDKDVTTARNSKAREVSADPLDRLAGFIDEKAPGVTPSHITRIGKGMVEGAAALVIAKPDRGGIATAIYTVGSLFDTFDGSLARNKGVDGPEGMIEDVQADLEQQIATMGALSVVAMRRGNRVAAANYAAAAMLTPLSAYTRALSESQGLIVAEGGMGTRLGRGIMGGVGMALNKRRDASDIVSAMLASGTANTVLERRDVIRNGEESSYCLGMNEDPGFMEEGAMRRRAIGPYAEAGLAVGAALLAANGSKAIQERIPKVSPAVADVVKACRSADPLRTSVCP